MGAGPSRNLPLPLDRVAAVYRGPGARSQAADMAVLDRLAGRVATGVRFTANEPEAMRRLRRAAEGVREAPSLGVLLPRVLDGAVALMGADFGNVQLVDPRSGALRIVTQTGFGSRFIDYFSVLNDDNSACGRAVLESAQVVIADVDTDVDFTPHRGVAADAGFRSVQSTPLVDYAGRTVGIVSTHSRLPYRPSGLDLRIMELYADYTGQAIAERLGLLDHDRAGDPIGRAVIAALFDPESHPHATVPAALRDDALCLLPGFVVNRLFSVGLRLANARGTDGPAVRDDELVAATAELDELIRDIRSIMYEHTADLANHAPR